MLRYSQHDIYWVFSLRRPLRRKSGEVRLLNAEESRIRRQFVESTQLTNISDRQNSLEWRLYQHMLVTRLFEEALIRWEHEGKITAQTFPSKGQEAIAVGSCLALENGDT